MPSRQTTVDPLGTTTVVFAGGEGLLLLTHAGSSGRTDSTNTSKTGML